MFRATLKSLLSRKLRLVMSGLAVVLGVMFVSGAFVLTDTLSRSFDSLFRSAYSTIDVSVGAKPKIASGGLEDGPPAPATLPADVVERVRAVPGVASAAGDVSAEGARVIGANGKVVPSFGPPRLGTNWVDGSRLAELREGHGPAADNQIAVNASLAKAAGIKVGDQVSVLTLQPRKTFTLVGIFGYSGGRDTLGGATQVAFTDPVAQELMLGEKNAYSSVTVDAAPGVQPAALRDAIQSALGDRYEVKTGKQLADDAAAGFEQALSFFNNILLGFAAVALFVGVFLILNTFSIIIAQRTRELALLRALGSSRRQVIGSVLLEAVAIGLVAAVLGLGAGIGVGALLAKLFTAATGGLELAGIGVPAASVISAFVVGVLVTVVAAVLPALRASRIPPVAAMADVATPDRPLTRVTVLGGVVSAAGAALLTVGLSGAGDATLWLILAGVLVSFIGVALLTPLIGRPVVSLLGRIFSWSVPGRLGRLNSGRNPRRTAITAAALMVGIALITGVNVVLQSATKSLDKIATDSVDAQLFIGGDPTEDRPPTFDPTVITEAGKLPGVRTAVGEYFDQAMVNGTKTYLVATTDAVAAADIFSVKVNSGAIGALGADQMVINSDAAKKFGLAVGQSATVQLSRGEPHRFTVVAVTESSPVFPGILLPPAAAEDFAVRQLVAGYIQLRPGVQPAQVQPDVDRLLADSPEVSVVDRSGFLKQQTSGVDQVLQMIQILLALAILIAVLGVINTLVLSVIERTRELGLLRAIGLRRGQTAGMVTVESVVISVFGALLGLAVGAGLGAAVVRALNSQGITELVFPWSQMATYLALGAIIGVVAALLPALRAARLNVLNAIAHE
ncbi:ABC transporter permease [Rhizomonospora bruguierae]|uniref:ABC transporter permease n=1 Tax=Rhizomonospora bruguierae TaxID=1581705 RepID=UPI001BCD1349|nr:ABC transporter permease [Micromonospora sp. NBRC 107566]